MGGVKMTFTVKRLKFGGIVLELKQSKDKKRYVIFDNDAEFEKAHELMGQFLTFNHVIDKIAVSTDGENLPDDIKEIIKD
jgi:hypothetical protein